MRGPDDDAQFLFAELSLQGSREALDDIADQFQVLAAVHGQKMHDISLGQGFKDNVVHFIGEIHHHIMIVPDKTADKKADLALECRIFGIERNIQEIHFQTVAVDAFPDFFMIGNDLRQINGRDMPAG